ncbi:MAG: S1C family serine protease [Candidatus Paceibacterota bacterium]
MSETVKKIGIIIAVFVIGAVGGIFSTEILWPSVVEAPLFDGYRMPKEKVEINKTEKITVTENEALQDAIKEVKSSVVSIKGKGTGFIITSDGLIVTLSSIADSTSTVVYNEKELEAGLVKSGERFTTLKVEKNDLPTRGLANIDEAGLGQRVFLIGKLSNETTVVNHGIIKYFDEGIYTNIYENERLEGAPLFDIKGEVLGLVTIEKGEVVAYSLPGIDQLIEE